MKNIVIAIFSAVIGFASAFLIFEKPNWRVFVLHDSQKVNIKVK